MFMVIVENQWVNDDDFQKILKVYNFVRDDIIFRYNTDDVISASEVLKV